MKVLNWMRNAAVATLATMLVACASNSGTVINHSNPTTQAVKFQQVRNATIKIEYAGSTFLVDPVLARKGTYPGFEGTYNSHLRNPLVELPFPAEEVIKADAVILTHLHLDHWDDAAKQLVPKKMPIFVQNEEDAASIRKDGFTDVRVLTDETIFNGTRLSRTGGQHGNDKVVAEISLLGKVSGVVFRRPLYKTVYVAGDTVWNHHVEEAIHNYRPDLIVLNTGYTRILGYEGSIIMGKEDLLRAYQAAPNATVIGSHMESVNHGMQSRQDLRDYIVEKGMDRQRVLVPADGESYRF